jgi:Uma2 family endonuclease
MTAATLVQLAPLLIEGHVTFDNISWDLYEDILESVGERPIHMTYDRGRLEIVTVSERHEKVKTAIARLLEAYADAMEINIEGLGSTTFKRKDLLRGLEPDECYYVADAADIAGKDKLDLKVDPPPDLAIEVEISPPDVARVPIYAALGVPEVWHYDEEGLKPMRRTRGGTYVPAERSLAFPDLPMDRFGEFVEIALARGQSAGVRALRRWLAGLGGRGQAQSKRRPSPGGSRPKR